MMEKIRAWLDEHNLKGRRLYVAIGVVGVMAILVIWSSSGGGKKPETELGMETPEKRQSAQLGSKPGTRGSAMGDAIQLSEIPQDLVMTRLQQKQDETDQRIKEMIDKVAKLSGQLLESQGKTPQGTATKEDIENLNLSLTNLRESVDPLLRAVSESGGRLPGALEEEDVRIIQVPKDKEEMRQGQRTGGGAPRASTGEGQTGKVASSDRKFYLPPGSMAPGVLLNGVDAPPIAQAGAVTHPVLILVKSPFKTANNYSVAMQGCFVMGKAEGDLSSERVLVQFILISCVFPGGRTLDRKLNGYVSGSDGKMGIAGKVYDKRSRKLGMAVLAGFTAGLSQAMGQSEVTRVLTAEGTERTFVSGSTMSFGMSQALGSALAELTNFYREQMSRLFPVVAVPSGTEVTVVVSEGVDVPEMNNLFSATANDMEAQ